MPRQIAVYRLRRDISEPQSIQMPRRARITGIQLVAKEPALQLYTEVDHDQDTQAFDTGRHERTFTVRQAGDLVPAEGALVGFHNGLHVYEVKS